MTRNSVSDNLSIQNDVHASVQNSKSVECRLQETYGKLAVAEELVELFKNLMRHNLATNDVTNFVKKQSIHKRVLSNPDLNVQKAAMKSKFLDALSCVRRLRKDRDILKSRLAKKYEGRKSLRRRIEDKLVMKYRMMKRDENEANLKKFSHIQQKRSVEKELTSAPPEASDILASVNIFSERQNSITPEESLGPFICDPSIKLAECELKILARGPKFLVRGELDQESFEVELERSIAKAKYDSMFGSKDDNAALQDPLEAIDTAGVQQTKPSAESSKTHLESNFVNEGIKNELNVLWEENCGRMVYNADSKSFDFGNMQATAYKHNRDVFLPPPPRAQTRKLVTSSDELKCVESSTEL